MVLLEGIEDDELEVDEEDVEVMNPPGNWGLSVFGI